MQPRPQQQAQTHYEILGLVPEASLQDIKQSYRALALKWHPDKNRQPEAPEMFKKIGGAYAVLSDPDLRKNYDLRLPKKQSTQDRTPSPASSNPLKKNSRQESPQFAADPFVIFAKFFADEMRKSGWNQITDPWVATLFPEVPEAKAKRSSKSNSPASPMSGYVGQTVHEKSSPFASKTPNQTTVKQPSQSNSPNINAPGDSVPPLTTQYNALTGFRGNTSKLLAGGFIGASVTLIAALVVFVSVGLPIFADLVEFDFVVLSLALILWGGSELLNSDLLRKGKDFFTNLFKLLAVSIDQLLQKRLTQSMIAGLMVAGGTFLLSTVVPASLTTWVIASLSAGGLTSIATYIGITYHAKLAKKNETKEAETKSTTQTVFDQVPPSDRPIQVARPASINVETPMAKQQPKPSTSSFVPTVETVRKSYK